MKKVIPFILLLFLSENLFAQSAGLRGFVRDSATGETIPHATVRIMGTDKGTYSNMNGFYFINNVPFGTYDVQISAVGFETLKKSIRLI